MVTALVMLYNIKTVFHLSVLEKNVVIKGNVYAITQFFTLLHVSTGKQEKKSDTIKRNCAPSHSFFQKSA